MAYKKTWNMGYGRKKIITGSNSSLELLEADMLRLRRGEEAEYDEKDKEFALVVLSGTNTVTGKDFEFRGVGKRKNVFDGPAASVYVPANTPFVIMAESETVIAVSKSPSKLKAEPVLIKPEDVVIKHLGKTGWEREAHFILDERVKAKHLYIGEAFVSSGNWASYPPHKHDEDKMPAEGILEEIYYYEFDKPDGFGIQKVYTKEDGPDDGRKKIDLTYTVKTGDFVEIPRGYHPFCVAPGYNAYYLWIMAGENRGFFMTTEEKHKWLNK
ncbi:MAG: 5-deoxy-glucuronate isomerase [Eubacteriales bacterium]|nr:5-deoxy-glucuronate isomerase [Eubacteriales bacterium]